MTVARLYTSTAHHRPQGFEGAVLRLGSMLVAWAHRRARASDALRRDDRLHRWTEQVARLESERERTLAQSAIVRMF